VFTYASAALCRSQDYTVQHPHYIMESHYGGNSTTKRGIQAFAHGRLHPVAAALPNWILLVFGSILTRQPAHCNSHRGRGQLSPLDITVSVTTPPSKAGYRRREAAQSAAPSDVILPRMGHRRNQMYLYICIK
jgi:hypothetical protein